MLRQIITIDRWPDTSNLILGTRIESLEPIAHRERPQSTRKLRMTEERFLLRPRHHPPGHFFCGPFKTLCLPSVQELPMVFVELNQSHQRRLITFIQGSNVHLDTQMSPKGDPTTKIQGVLAPG